MLSVSVFAFRQSYLSTRAPRLQGAQGTDCPEIYAVFIFRAIFPLHIPRERAIL